jgi:hypothetical protein
MCRNGDLAGRGIMMHYLGVPAIATLTGIDLPSSIDAFVDALWRTRDATHDQFQPVFTLESNDRLYIAQYKKLMGAADNVRVWDLQAMDKQQKQGLCQSIGLDALGAAIRLPS